jgi:chromosomal replication initiation ATPase DnaA
MTGSYPDLARAFGGSTTVISAVQKIIERVTDDASLGSRSTRSSR